MSGPESSLVLTRQDGPVAWITLNRPERLNAFGGTMREDLAAAVGASSAREGTRVIAITGTGRAFSAGADLGVTRELVDAGDEAAFLQLVEAGMDVVRRIRAVPQPVVAVLNGVAAGAGASLAAACDLRIAADDARISFDFARIGLHPDWGATYSLPRLVGAARAAELVYTGRMLQAAEALQLGLLDGVFPAGVFAEQAAAWLAELAAQPPLSMAAAKRSFAKTGTGDLEIMLATEAAAQLTCFRSADLREGIAAFLEKRTPAFHGA